MKWIYKNKKTGEQVTSPCIDSKYWTPDWECIEADYPKTNPEFTFVSIEDKNMTNKRGFFDDSQCFPKVMPDLPEKEDMEGASQAGYDIIGSILFPPKKISQTTHDRIKSQKTDNSPPNPFAEMQEYKAETVEIPIPELENALDALQAGLEHTQLALTEHDASLGRTTRRNKFWAQTLEADIAAMEKSIKCLKMKLVEQTTSYP